MPSVYFAPDEMCTMLKLEVRRIYDYFLANGWTAAATPEEADKVIAPTCAGWDKLETNSLNMLAALAPMADKVVALGCVNTMNSKAMAKVHKGATIASVALDQAAGLIPDAKVALADIPEPSTFRSKEDYRLYDLSKRFVNVAFGCAFTCAYCPHKVGIGPRKSRSLDSIVDQVRQLMTEGVRIVVLTGMETGLYGREIGTNYVAMLREVLAAGDTFQIHVAQFHPSGIRQFEDDFAELFGNARVTDVQIPIQTTSARLLKLMSRPPLPDGFGDVMRRVKAANPKVILRTDIIVGYPGETEEELSHTLDFVEDIFDEVAVYGFEMKAGLPAEQLAHMAIPDDEIARRKAWATQMITAKGCLAHGGQQADLDLVALEELKQNMRRSKSQLA
ncbi:MAG: radical SAM protein [Rhodospirillaceae bacterium]|nr:radical SAM protein [Rhodospirillales bacterium]